MELPRCTVLATYWRGGRTEKGHLLSVELNTRHAARDMFPTPNLSAKYLVGRKSTVLPPPDLHGVAKRPNKRKSIATAGTTFVISVISRDTSVTARDAFLSHSPHPRRDEVISVSPGEGAVVGQAPARQKGVSDQIHLLL